MTKVDVTRIITTWEEDVLSAAGWGQDSTKAAATVVGLVAGAHEVKFQ